MQIIDLTPEREDLIRQVAQILVEAFAGHSPAWTTLEEGLEEVRESFAEKRISRVALDDEGNVLGWIGGIEMYDGNVWELHPLAVSPAAQSKGVGRALVLDLEEQVRQHGALTLWLGSDDEDYRTTLGGVDLYPNPLEHAAKIQNPGRHPYGFYEKMGFVVVGVMPDANGFGKPDIFMAKRVAATSI
jgi:aminoglycoside 6'-N-acetyltransferase I